MSTSSPEAVKKLLENMQTDLRSLSMECKKKFPPVKEVIPVFSLKLPPHTKYGKLYLIQFLYGKIEAFASMLFCFLNNRWALLRFLQTDSSFFRITTPISCFVCLYNFILIFNFS